MRKKERRENPMDFRGALSCADPFGKQQEIRLGTPAIQQRRRAGCAFKGADKGTAAVKTAALGNILNGEVGVG